MVEYSSSFPVDLSISEFGYDLPDEKIARYPIANRDHSKLLIWKAGVIQESIYADLPHYLPVPSLLVFNNSRVVEARILFQKSSGGQIEIFCLEPHEGYSSISQAMAEKGKVLWICLIGGASKWKHGQILEKKIGSITLRAQFVEKRKDDFIVSFSWLPQELSFAEILHIAGLIPLPPYLKRTAELSDIERYQTVYASESGSVAAPTAGLHFTEKILHAFNDKGIGSLYLTLHVGAGTFMPVKSDKLLEHHMHEEFIEITATALQRLINMLNETIIAVGTTSLRTLETLYWLGYSISLNKNIAASALHLDQWTPYEKMAEIPAFDALNLLLEWILRQPEQKLISKTRLFIVPGYRFKIVRGLITNFHQPNSTLLLLVAALVGPSWKNVYRWALDHDYRFLSYGDGCLFLP